MYSVPPVPTLYYCNTLLRYGTLLLDADGAELVNCTAGYLLRTKRAEGNETGIAAVSALSCA